MSIPSMGTGPEEGRIQTGATDVTLTWSMEPAAGLAKSPATRHRAVTRTANAVLRTFPSARFKKGDGVFLTIVMIYDINERVKGIGFRVLEAGVQGMPCTSRISQEARNGRDSGEEDRKVLRIGAGSYKTAGAVLLDKEDLKQSHRSSGRVTMQSVETPPFTAGMANATEPMPRPQNPKPFTLYPSS
jgi:hypothetical protein